jgi:regulator of RNase E activity RraA
MNNQELNSKIGELAAAHFADACVRLKLPLILPPPGIQTLIPGGRIAGRVLPARHYGSVDIFLEALESADQGDILVIDNQGRTDEGCIGDLTVLELQDAGLAGVIVWGYHRDTAELRRIGFPVFTYGTTPAGPTRLDPPPPRALEAAQFGNYEVGRSDFVVADDDGVIFIPQHQIDDVISTAFGIWEKDRQQALDVQAGHNLREQFRFSEYLSKRAADPSYSFRAHLRSIGGAIEE